MSIRKKWCAGMLPIRRRMREVENLVLEDNVVAWVMAGAKVSDKAVTLNELMGSN